MLGLRSFSNEQSRLLVNLRMRYEAWIDLECERVAMPYDLRRKTVGANDYLYLIYDRGGNGKSLGPWDARAKPNSQPITPARRN